MDRRDFFKVAAVACVSPIPTLAATPALEKVPLRKVWRWDGKQWRRCRMIVLKEGDTFKVQGIENGDDDGIYVAHSDATPIPGKDDAHIFGRPTIHPQPASK